MKIVLVIFGYLKWHYSRAIRSLSDIWWDFLYFIYNYFSLRALLNNFFDPWKRMSDSYPKSFILKDYFYAFITNLIVRVFGMFMRAVLIIIGVLCYLLLALLFPLALILWLILPVIIIALLGAGLVLIIK